MDLNGYWIWKGISNKWLARGIDVAILIYTFGASISGTKATHLFIKKNRRKLVKTIEKQLIKMIGRVAASWTGFALDLVLTISGLSIGSMNAWVIDNYIDGFYGAKKGNGYCFG